MGEKRLRTRERGNKGWIEEYMERGGSKGHGVGGWLERGVGEGGKGYRGGGRGLGSTGLGK